MNTKKIIYICIAIFSVIGSLIGSKLDGGNLLGIWGILLGLVGSFVGVWVGYQIGNYLE